MNNQEKIEFNQARKFGDKINITFSYVSQNFKSLALSLIYILAPFVLIGGIAFGYLMDWYFRLIGNVTGGQDPISMMDIPTLTVAALGISIAMVFSVSLIVTVVYSHMMIYKETELHKIEVSEVWERVKSEFSGILGLQIGLFIILIFGGIIIGGILIGIPIFIDSIFLSVLGGLGLYILIIYISIALSLTYVIKMNEKLEFFALIQRSLYLIRGKWWSTFGLLFIMQLIAAMISYLFAIPLYIMMFANIFHSIETGSGNPFEGMEGMGFFGIAAYTLYLFGYFLVYSLPFIALGFQYFNLIELKEAAGLMGKIETIGNEEISDDSDEDY